MRDYHRKKLNKLLGAARDEEFVQLLWATNILQSGNPGPAQRFFMPDTIPDGAITSSMTSALAIQKWEIETLANELMTVPKASRRKNGELRMLRCNHFGVAIDCVNWLRKLENVEYGIHNKRGDIFVEMGRIAARQFDWQRGYANVAQFYRNAFVYGQGQCATYFEQKNGVTLNRFSKIGFMLYAYLNNYAVARPDSSWSELGVTSEEVEKVLALVAMPFPEAVKLARRRREKNIPTAHRASILRQSPCLRFGENNERIRAPLPELILERVTSGVFYDVVGGGGPIRDDYGKRFEEYCMQYLSGMLPAFDWRSEFKYRKKPNTFDTPDILCSKHNTLIVAFECKATRMSLEAMFGKDPIVERGYQDLTKAVFQIWRFFSHCRRGTTGQTISNEAVGVVLTLDNWLVLASTLREKVLEAAVEMANEKDPEISKADRRPIVFVAVPDLELTLSLATEDTFLEALQKSNTKKFEGWRLDGVVAELIKDKECRERDYPFADDIQKILPWWNDFRGSE